ncbi:MAG: hypothetical protein ACREQN_08760 [Candidatus Binataceae bacterium]
MSSTKVNVDEISRLLYELKRPENRAACRANPAEFYRRYRLGEDDLALLERPDWCGLVEAGVSIYLLTKLAAATGADLLAMGAAMRGMSRDQFLAFIKVQNERNRNLAILPK